MSSVEVLKEMQDDLVIDLKEFRVVKKGNDTIKYQALDEALLALENKESDAVDFGFWLVNAPNKVFHKRSWIEAKYKQYKKEKESIKW